jgi:hypothetical protein
VARRSKTLPLGINLVTRARGLVPSPTGPTTPNWQRHQALPPARFRLFPFRSPLLRESLLLSLPRGTEMFQFPRFPPLALCVQTRVTPLRVPGFPIRTSTDRSSVGSSPWLIAATHVLHRHQAPRHPPLALHSLKKQMLVLAIEFSRSPTNRQRSCSVRRHRDERGTGRSEPFSARRAGGAPPRGAL